MAKVLKLTGNVMEYDAEIMLAFLEEIGGYLPQLRAHLAKLEVKAKDREALEECYRLAHTIKGTASTMGLNEISQQGLDMEQALLPIVEKKSPYTSDVGNILRTRLEKVEVLLDQMQRSFEEPATAPEPAPLPPPPPVRPAVQEPLQPFSFNSQPPARPATPAPEPFQPFNFEPQPQPPSRPAAPAPEPLQPFSFDTAFPAQPFN